MSPFYAVKCNNDDTIVRTLAARGSQFDCASAAEINQVLQAGAKPSDIIFAHPVKQPAHIEYARDRGVDLMTFDSEEELHKVKSINPNALMVMRIATDDRHSTCRFSAKFGADPDSVPFLLRSAKQLGVRVVGVSYHVGSGCYDVQTYKDALERARVAFDIAAGIGTPLCVLDIGGGFPGSAFGAHTRLGEVSLKPLEASTESPSSPDPYLPSVIAQAAAPNAPRETVFAGDGGSPSHATSSAAAVEMQSGATFPQVARALRQYIDLLFPEGAPTAADVGKSASRPTRFDLDRVRAYYAPGGGASYGSRDVQLLAEPGRYMVEASHTLFVNVVGRRDERYLVEGPEAVAGPTAAKVALASGRPLVRLYVNDGLYGSFNSILYDHASPAVMHLPQVMTSSTEDLTLALHEMQPVLPVPAGNQAQAAAMAALLAERERARVAGGGAAAISPHLGGEREPVSLWGQTCDGIDCLAESVLLPRNVKIGDWLVYDSMGAYTGAASCPFNGFELPRTLYVAADAPDDFNRGGPADDEDSDDLYA